MSAVVIPARYESSRLPGKPLVKINGITMINRVATRCLKSKADRVIVVTDDERILDECSKIEGLECVMSDKNIKSGTDRVAKVAKYLDEEIIVNVQGDEPLIDPELINSLIDELKKDDYADMITAYCDLDKEEALNPNNVKVVVDKNGYAIYFSRSLIPFVRDSKDIKYKKHIGIYGFKKDFLMKFTELPESELENLEKLEQLRVIENGYKIKVIYTTYKSLSVDTKDDLQKVEEIIKEMENG
ncbi:3-deoxy-manno-octulosonate cytidylyltransferase [Deferribacter autotrophicus]|uniref:3-deoxy-manno-octulosonate cytidylyltransferase n=1 Tax=Deferribacter autotrophicus TaxID=500465 RepID=A0A5A8F7P0_9BACT|nr:3-deoxy-manno-octulosonate cytidylyltransferase [Deferribacter autotrophicus]KAA0258187.1 3-deoxy-manno-octulosonate cytidylyltransferase [Deferribacter autotrophicus]